MRVNHDIFNAKLSYEPNIVLVLVHHYLFNEMRRNHNNELSISVKELSLKLGISIQKVRTSLKRLEEMNIIKSISYDNKRNGKSYKYVEGEAK
jgi:predicted transcriptional regulator